MKKLLVFFIILLTSCFFIVQSANSEEETLILFDSSVSMIDKLNGESKYILASRAASNILMNTPNSRKIGLRIIGMRLNDNLIGYITNPSLLCKATELVNPIMAGNLDNIQESLDMLIPLGTTPLTYSLEQAISKDFDNNADLKHIILITDGAESCDMNPCKFIREIMLKRKDIRIDVIAINVNNEDFTQLKCLADYTGGKIKTAQNEADIKGAFQTYINTYKPQVKSNASFDTNLRTLQYSNLQNNKNIQYRNYAFEID